MRRLSLACALSTALSTSLTALPATALAETSGNVIVVLDGSGSMWGQIEGKSKIAIARSSVDKVLSSLPDDRSVGLMAYGHRSKGSCSDIELVVPPAAGTKGVISSAVNALKPKGKTPLTTAVREAANRLAGEDKAATVVLVTDGIETCRADPCALGRELAESGTDFTAHVIGFGLSAREKEQVACLAEATGGEYIAAGDEVQLTDALNRTVVAAAPAPQPIKILPKKPQKPVAVDRNLLAAKNGGELVAAPNTEWLKLNDGKPDRATTYGGDGIWAFKDGKPATIDSVGILIPEKNQYNLKEIEVLVGDDGPLGEFTSLGTFKTRNLKMFKSPVQKFSFDPVKARFVKIRYLSDHGGGYIAGYETEVYGELDEAAEPSSVAVAPVERDILKASLGGELITAPNDEWLKLNDDKEDRATTYAGEGVFAFSSGKPATIDGIGVLIPARNQYNVREIEVLVGDDGPLGEFTSVGTFETQNLRHFLSPYQAFEFAPVTARFVKVRLVKDHGGGYVAAYDLQVYGSVDQAAAPYVAGTPATGTDLLAAANGGTLLAAPNDEWTKLNDGKEDRAVTYRGEGIWAFEGEQKAIFDRFELLIPGRNQYNVRQFTLSAADSLDGPFTEIGTFSTANHKDFRAPYQAFTFDPVQARYLKIALETDHGGGYIKAHEARLFGSFDLPAGSHEEAPVVTGSVPAAAEINLLAEANGGQLLAAPGDEWLKLNDGKEDRAVTYAGEGVWAFANDARATVSAVEMLIPEKDQYNIRKFEVLIGDDFDGPFVSAGEFETKNTKLFTSPYQRFDFPAIEGSLVKIIFKTDHGGGYIKAHEVRILGEFNS